MEIFLWCLLAFGLACTGLAFGLGLYLTHRYHLTQTRNPAELGLTFEDITFPSSDGLTLRGWWIPFPGSDRAIIQLHGHGGSMDPDIQYLPAWHHAGLNVLMFDFRGHGRSQGSVITFGYLERRDVLGAIRFVKDIKRMRRVALVGFSLGGMVSILSAPLSPEVDAVVEDGAPARIRSALAVWAVEHHLPLWFGKVLAWMAVAGASLRLDANLFHYEPIRWVGRIKQPLMIIHGELDQYCPDFDEMLPRATPAEVWRVPDAGHTQVSVVHPEEYRRRIVAFLDRYLI
jgi:dipeptidyl aminopeptidase/acylaminoacyl peptidase